EVRQGFADCFGGDRCALEDSAAPIGQWYALAHAPPRIKAWPCCFGIHPALTALRQLQQRVTIPVDAIAAVELTIGVETGTGPAFYRRAAAPLEGKFCREYTLAAALVDGRVEHAAYAPERLDDPRIQRLMGCITTRRDPEVALRSPRLRRPAHDA